MFERARGGERAILLLPYRPGRSDPEAEAEFDELARAAGAEVAGALRARIDRIHPGLLIGRGKVGELKALVAERGAELVLVNHALSPVQERNLERELGCRVVDRTGLILDIFAQRARTHEGKLQVELAQLRHLATRLVRGWTHLERQRGGAIGLRGPGETQLELDRRLIARRIHALEQRLAEVERQRAQARRARLRRPLPLVAIVGYTNAGKSTLFNALTRAGVFVADQPFATLDPTVRRIDGWPCGPFVLADTVGFVRELPHELVAAFRATLDETRDADLLLEVVDASDGECERRIAEVDRVLAEIGAGETPRLLVFNKIDRLPERPVPVGPAGPRRLFVSALTGEGLPALRQAVSEALGGERLVGELRLPASAGALRARLHDLGAVRRERAEGEGWVLELDIRAGEALRLAGSFPLLGAWCQARHEAAARGAERPAPAELPAGAA
ncbi:MAG: ribosome rescue GTPase HflX [Xanthomonadales bacterium]|nr:ribosome rescue GTPase HflX [Xanthomonadales bacterium]